METIIDKKHIVSEICKLFGRDDICIKIEDIDLSSMPDQFRHWGVQKYSAKQIEIVINIPKTPVNKEEEKQVKDIFTRQQVKYLE